MLFRSVEKHELTGVELETLLAEGVVDRPAERHELRFDASELRKRTHGEEHFFEKAAADVRLGEALRDVQTADETLLLLENVERITGSGAVFEGYTAAESMSFQETFDEIEGAAIVPVELIVPVAGLFLEEGLELANTGLAKVVNIHGRAGRREGCRASP